jgi:DNA repair exonuclease SbcCD nuclease subunit
VFGIISDTHCHSWSAFGSVDEHGVNTRLRIILDQMKRAAQAVKDAGGSRLIHAGDLFHERNSLEPATLNPTLETIAEIVNMGIQFDIIPGNHDLGTRHTTWNSNASSALHHVGANVIIEPSVVGDVLFVPWMDSVKKLRSLLIDWSKQTPGVDVVLHAPLNSVLAGIPDTGLDPSQLAQLDFKRVFCGHYHHHKCHLDSVYSIGSLTHQTWGDVEHVSGFLLVDDTSVQHVPDTAPKFIDFDPKNQAAVAGNYVRFRVEVKNAAEAERLREGILKLGAAGVVVQPIIKASNQRIQSTVQAGASIQQSIADWIQTNKPDDADRLTRLCESILEEAA